MQHGHMEQVGYDTYCKLLDEVVKEMKGIEVKEEQEVQIDLSVSSYIPDEYIPDASQKIEIYQEIALCRTEQDIANIIDEMIDRYGTMPKEVENLIQIARIKELCKQTGVIKLMQKTSNIVLVFDNATFSMKLVDLLLQQYKNRIKFSPGKDPYVTYQLENLTQEKRLTEMEEVLKCVKKDGVN